MHQPDRTPQEFATRRDSVTNRFQAHRLNLLQSYFSSIGLSFGEDLNPQALAKILREDLISLESKAGGVRMLGVHSALSELTRDLAIGVDEQDSLVSFGRFTYEPELRNLSTPYSAQEKHLTGIEGAIMHKLIVNGGHVVTYGRIMEFVDTSRLGSSVMDGPLLKTHVTHLRSKIGDKRELIDGERSFRHLRNFPQVGYGFFDDTSRLKS